MMIRAKFYIKILGLCIVASALSSVVATGAQAATWLILEGTTVVERGEGVAETDTFSILHSRISGVEVLYECSTVSLVGVKLEAGGSTSKGGKVKFSGCITKLNGATSAACEPNSGGTEKGVVVTKAGHAFLYLHSLAGGGSDELFEVVPDEGETFATIEMGKECSIGTKVPVIGLFYLKDCENKILVHQEKHLIEEGPLTELWVISKTAEHKASLLGSWWLKVLLNGVFRSFAGHV